MGGSSIMNKDNNALVWGDGTNKTCGVARGQQQQVKREEEEDDDEQQWIGFFEDPQNRLDDKSEDECEATMKAATITTPTITTSSPITKRVSTWSHKNKFPSRLHDILNDAEKNGHSEIISWDHDGKSFTIYQWDDSILVPILGKYFRTQSNYKSLLRQLQDYSFQRVNHKRGCAKIVKWTHPQFQRGLRSLSFPIKPKSVKFNSRTRNRRAASAIATSTKQKKRATTAGVVGVLAAAYAAAISEVDPASSVTQQGHHHRQQQQQSILNVPDCIVSSVSMVPTAASSILSAFTDNSSSSMETIHRVLFDRTKTRGMTHYVQQSVNNEREDEEEAIEGDYNEVPTPPIENCVDDFSSYENHDDESDDYDDVGDDEVYRNKNNKNDKRNNVDGFDHDHDDERMKKKSRLVPHFNPSSSSSLSLSSTVVGTITREEEFIYRDDSNHTSVSSVKRFSKSIRVKNEMDCVPANLQK